MPGWPLWETGSVLISDAFCSPKLPLLWECGRSCSPQAGAGCSLAHPTAREAVTWSPGLGTSACCFCSPCASLIPARCHGTDRAWGEAGGPRLTSPPLRAPCALGLPPWPPHGSRRSSHLWGHLRSHGGLAPAGTVGGGGRQQAHSPVGVLAEISQQKLDPHSCGGKLWASPRLRE